MRVGCLKNPGNPDSGPWNSYVWRENLIPTQRVSSVNMTLHSAPERYSVQSKERQDKNDLDL